MIQSLGREFALIAQMDCFRGWTRATRLVGAAVGVALAGGVAGQAAAQQVILDQIGAEDGSDLPFEAFVSQDFTAPENEDFDVAAVDDFVLGNPTTLSQVQAAIFGDPVTGFNDFDSIESYTIAVYDSPETAATDLSDTIVSVSFDEPDELKTTVFAGVRIASFNVDITLAPGTYWIAVIPSNSFEDNGQTFVMGSELGDPNAQLANPGGGFKEFDPGVPAPVEDENGNPLSLAYTILAGEIPPDACLPDLNDDGTVGVSDLLALLSQWGTCDKPCSGDFDDDDVVGVSDLLTLLGEWGPCPGEEPFTCPSGLPTENEPCVTNGTDPADDPNGGCNVSPPSFGSIACGETICGSASTFTFDGESQRDTDWFTFEVPLTGADVILTLTSEAPLIFATVNIDDCGDAQFIESAISLGGGQPTELTTTLPQGTYAAFVAHSEFEGLPCSSGENDYTIEMTCDDPSKPVPGDGTTCETATPVEIGQTIMYDNEGNPQGSAPSCGAGSPNGPTVWFQVVGDGTTLTATTCGASTLADTVMSVFCESCATPGCIGANDDDFQCLDPNPALSTVQWCSEPGVTYRIAVWGGGGNQGTGEFSVTSDGKTCSEPTECEPTLQPGDCVEFVTGNFSNANLVTGLRPNDSVGGWGQAGVIEDIIVLEQAPITDIQMEFLDLFTPLGEPSGVQFMQLEIYEGPVEDVDHFDDPVFEELFVVDVNATLTDTGVDFEDDSGAPVGDVEAWTLTPTDLMLEPGEYAFFVRILGLPSNGQVGYFWASGDVSDFSPKQYSAWGFTPQNVPIPYIPAKNHGAFCASN